LAQNRAKFLESQAAGTWQADDPNHTKQAIILMDLVAGQRDYSFRYDEEGAEIQEILKVLVADPNYVFHELVPRDPQSESERLLETNNGLSDVSYGGITGFTNGLDATGTPRQMDLSGNTITLDPVPDYSWRLSTEGKQGIKAYVNRDDSFFLPTDTDKVPGLIGLFHEYLVLRPSLKYAERNGMSVAGGTMRGGYKTGLLSDVYEMEEGITTYYGSRKRVGRNRLTTAPINPF
jgi:hypothetical protein